MHEFEPIFRTPNEAAAFSSGLATRAVGRALEYRQHTSSTNDLAAAAARAGAPHGWVAVAEEQSAGRGRRGRRWLAPARRALLFSLLVRGPGLRATRSGWLALASASAAAEALLRTASLAARVKWPNDVVVTHPAARPPWRKLGGVLVESGVSRSSAAAGHAVVGIGINVHQTQADLPSIPKAPATSVRIETDLHLSRRELLVALLVSLEERLSWIQEPDRFPEMRSVLRACLDQWWQGWSFRTHGPDANVAGRYAGLDAQARLRLQAESGALHLLADAEIVDGSVSVGRFGGAE
jgi:BirA family biotin operon repressor/biotin-[acetyl-CoA-carboxylase] ligase